MDYFSVDRRHTYSIDEHLALEPNGIPGNEIESHIFAQFPSGFSRHGAQYFRDVPSRSQTPDDVNSLYIELFLETTRRAYYSDKPSRYESIFASGTLEDAQHFRSVWGQPTHGIFILRPEGAVHRGDMNLLKFGQTAATTDHKMHLYWQGKTLTGVDGHAPIWEYVLALPALVVAQVA